MLFSPNPREKFFFYQNFSTNQILRKNQIQLFDFFLIEIERWANTDAENIPLTFVVFSKFTKKNFFFWNFRNQSEFEKKSNSILGFFSHWNREIDEQWCWKNFIDLCCILQNRQEKIFIFSQFFDQSDFKTKWNSILRFFLSLESRDQWTVMLKKFDWPLLFSPNPREKIFFSQLFSTNQNSRKNQNQFFDFFHIEIERSVNSDAEKIPLTFVVFSKSARKIFFFSHFFDQSEFEKNWNSILPLFLHWNRETSERWCWINSIDHCCAVQIGEKKIFSSSKWFHQSDFENKSNFILPLFLRWNRETSENWCWKNSSDICCTLKIREKKYLFLKFFEKWDFDKKIQFNYFSSSLLESRHEWTLMLKKPYWSLFVVRSRGEKNIFPQNFSTNQNSRKNQNQFFDFFHIEIERSVNSDAEKIPLTFVVFSKSARKIFFFSHFFDQSEFEKNWNSILPLFLHWNRETSERWCWINSIDHCCAVQIGEKKIFSSSKWFHQSDFENKSNFILPLFLRWNRETSENWCWKNSSDICCTLKIREKKYLFLKFFEKWDFDKKIQFNYFTSSLLESRHEWTLMLKKPYWSLFVVRSRGEKNIFPQNFSTNQNSRENEIHVFHFFSIGIGRPVATNAQKILFTFNWCPQSLRKKYFSIKTFKQSYFEKKSNSILPLFHHWYRETSDQ